MSDTYFDWLERDTLSRVWINNPTTAEVGLALASGAVACTSNPAYGGNLLQRAPDEIAPIITAVAAGELRGDAAAAAVQQQLVGRLLPHFASFHERTGGREGWVSLQGAPELDTSVGPILEFGPTGPLARAQLHPQDPATEPGLEALDELVREDQPTLMTEVFSLAQVVETCERYLRASSDSGNRPAFIMAPITGIFGDHYASVAARDSLDVQPATLRWAGIIWARAASGSWTSVVIRCNCSTAVRGRRRTSSAWWVGRMPPPSTGPPSRRSPTQHPSVVRPWTILLPKGSSASSSRTSMTSAAP